MPNVKILVRNNRDIMCEPIVLDDVKVDMTRQGSPETLTFTIAKDTTLGQIGGIHEGNGVIMQVDNKDFFKGIVFTKSRDKEGLIKITAYSQLRYLKNKFTFQYADKTAAEVVEEICGLYGLKAGSLADTQYKIPFKLEDNCTMLDVIQNAIEDTMINAKPIPTKSGDTVVGYVRPIYVLFDYCGKIMLQSVDCQGETNDKGEIIVPPMQLDYGLDVDVAENYSYTSSIDEDTYNSVVLIRDNKIKTQNTMSDIGYVGGSGVAVGGSGNYVTNDGVSFVGAKPCTLAGLADVAAYHKSVTGNPLWITSVTDGTIHASGEISHGTGYKADVDTDDLEFNYAFRESFITYCARKGIYAADEYTHPSPNSTKGHLDLEFSGYNAAGVPTPKNVGATSSNSETVVREKVAVKNDESIKKWGKLEYFAKENEGTTDLKAKANIILNNKNRETRHLSIANALGDVRVRAGCTIIVNMVLGDIEIQDRMIVEKVTHNFSNNCHLMNLTLIGGSKYFFS